MDSRICQTISASPAKPGGLLLALGKEAIVSILSDNEFFGEG